MHKSYSDELIGEVLNKADAVQVVSQYVKLSKTGKNHKGLCPFHKEKTPSFIVSEDRQRFHCFGCGASGDVIEFIMRMEKLDFVDALEYLAERSGIRLDDYLQKRGGAEPSRDKTGLYALMKDAAIYYFMNLKRSPAALDYLSKRGIDSETMKIFGLGFAPDQWDGLIKYLHEKKGYSLKDLEQCGLIISRKNASGFYDRFRNRIMFPIFDIRGRVVGFGGRVLNNDLPKYLNSPETDLFNKRNLLFGLNYAKHHTGVQKRIIVVEGYMDVISLYARGVKNAVASLGTALTEEQADLLKRYGKEIVMSYDSDSAGKKAVMKALEVLEKTPCKVRILNLTGAKDPDEYVGKNGVEAYRKAIEDSLPVLEHRIEILRTQFDRRIPQERIAYLEALKALFDTIEEPMHREIYLKRIKNEEYEVGELLEKSLGDKENGKSGKRRPSNRVYKVDAGKKHETARVFLRLLMTGKDVFEQMKGLFEAADFELETHRNIYEALGYQYETGNIIDLERLPDELDIESIEELRKIAAVNTEGIMQVKERRKTLYECIVAIRFNRLENELARLDKNNLKKEGDLMRIKELYNELNHFRNLRGRTDALTEADLLPPESRKGGESNRR